MRILLARIGASIGALPNLFVGIGLLLTFVGLVAALTFTTKAIGGAATSQQTQEALKDLLHAASFKFYTSIAGLLVSIALTMTLRCSSATLENRLGIFATELELRIHLVTLEGGRTRAARRSETANSGHQVIQ